MLRKQPIATITAIFQPKTPIHHLEHGGFPGQICFPSPAISQTPGILWFFPAGYR
jgi:hypothetical protein